MHLEKNNLFTRALKARGDLSLPASLVSPIFLHPSLPLVTENSAGPGPTILAPSPLLLLLHKATARWGNRCPQTSLASPALQNRQLGNIQTERISQLLPHFPPTVVSVSKSFLTIYRPLRLIVSSSQCY